SPTADDGDHELQTTATTSGRWRRSRQMAANTTAVPCWRNRRNLRGGGGDRQRNRRSKVEKSKKSEEEDSNRT
ncbi:hypothetical protein Dimus_029378, partial [Dionaea muscipula]